MRRSDLIKLSRILGMLGSDHAGERASAALAAHRLQKASGRTWWQLLAEGTNTGRATPKAAAWIDPFADPVRAAESRMRQLRRENEDLVRENRRLRQRLDTRSGGRR